MLAYSEGALVPCSVTADMTLAQATVELVKVTHVTASKNKAKDCRFMTGTIQKHCRCRMP